jgi:hypothetical protein
VRDLLFDFGNGNIKPLLSLTDVEFEVIQKFAAAKCLIVDHVLPGQDVAARLNIEKIIRARRDTTTVPRGQ